MKHSKEPWRVEFAGHVFAGDNNLIAGTMGRQDNFSKGLLAENIANAERIVACVNACAGISTDNLETLPIVVKLGVLQQHRDELLAALKLDNCFPITTGTEQALAEEYAKSLGWSFDMPLTHFADMVRRNAIEKAEK